MLLSDYINATRQLIHDTSSIDYSDSDVTLYVNEARNRVAADFYCVRTYFTNLSAIVNQETYPITGGVGGATVTAGGSYGSTPPTVTFSAPPAGGVTATGTAVLNSAGAVVQIAMTNWGLGYTSAPTITFGSGAAAATAVALINVIDLYSVSYLYPPANTGIQGSRRQMLLWAPFGHFNAFYRFNTVNAGAPMTWTSYTSQNLFYLYPSQPDQNYVLEIDAFVYPHPLVNTTDVDAQINTPVNELVQYQAAYKALLKAQNFDQADYYDKKYEARQQQLQRTMVPPRRPNVYQNLWRRVQRGY